MSESPTPYEGVDERPDVSDEAAWRWFFEHSGHPAEAEVTNDE